MHGTLHGRIIVANSAVLLIAMFLFVLLARTGLGELQSEFTDERLRVAATLVASSVAATKDRERPDLALLPKLGVDGAILGPHESIVATSAPLPFHIAWAGMPLAQPQLTRARSGRDRFRVILFPLVAHGLKRLGICWWTVDTINDFDRRMSLTFLLAIPAIVGAAFFTGLRLTRVTLAPLQELTGLTKTIEATDLSRRIDTVPSTRELAELCGTFNRMLSRLQSAFERQRRFTADVSHELRTPLSVIIAEADLALQTPCSVDELRAAIAVIFNEATAIEGLTSDLLAVARNEMPAVRQSAVNEVRPILARAAERLATLARARNVTVRIASIASWPIGVRGDPDVILQIFVSLLHNAIKFSAEGGFVDVAVYVGNEIVGITLEDGGPGFSSDALDHAFERFWKGVPSRNRDGSGLGLAIVKSLVETSGGTIQIGNAPSGGGSVIVRFPAVEVVTMMP